MEIFVGMSYIHTTYSMRNIQIVLVLNFVDYCSVIFYINDFFLFILCFFFNLGQKVSNLDELELNVALKGRVIKTDKNEQFTVDLVICCAGNKINSNAYRSSLGKVIFLSLYR